MNKYAVQQESSWKTCFSCDAVYSGEVCGLCTAEATGWKNVSRGPCETPQPAPSGTCAVCKAPAPYLVEKSQQWVCHRHLDGVIRSYGQRVALLVPKPEPASPYVFRKWSPSDAEVRLNGVIVATALRKGGEWHLFAWPTREKVATALTLDELKALAADALQIEHAA